MADPNSKPCTKCKCVKPLAEFEIEKRRKSGYGPLCRLCANALNNTYNALPRVRQRMKELRSRPEAHAKHIEGLRQWYAANPHTGNHPRDKQRQAEYNRSRSHSPEVRARKRFYAAISLGRITRPNNCSVCGKQCKPHGHHDDYSKPYDVLWVCTKCHGDIHRTDISKLV